MSRRDIIIIFILLIVAGLRFVFFMPAKPKLDDFVGREVSFRGFVDNDPDVRVRSKYLNVKILNQKAKILVMTGREVDVSYGDEVSVQGELRKPENFITSQGKEFNYIRYLANQDIYFLIRNPKLDVLSRGNGSKTKEILFKLKNIFARNINRVISPPESDLALGLLLGARGGFDEDMKTDLIETGTIHIVALSGYNVSLVAEGIMKTFSFVFSQTVSILFGIVVVFLFIIMTGVTATSVRAGLMAFIMLLGRMTGRKYLAGRALVVAGLLMIAYDPRVISDMSFQLSFLATGGVLFVTPKTIGWLKFLPMRFGIREMIATTIAATISVFPLLLYETGVFSVVSIFTNALILLSIPYAMLFVFLTGVLGFVNVFLSIPFALFSYFILYYILYIIKFFGSFDFASITIQAFPVSVTILIYAFLLWWIFKKKKDVL